MKKFIISTVIVALFFATLGFFYSYHLPEFKVWAIDRIENYSSKNAPVKVLVSNIEFNLLPIGVSLKNIQIIPKKELAEIANEAFVKEVRLSLNPFSFLTGLFQFSKIEIIDPQIFIKDITAIQKLKVSDGKDSKLNLRSILQIPLSTFVVHRMELGIAPKDNFPKINLSQFSLEVENQKTSALISFISPKLMVYDPKIADIPAEISLGSRILIQKDQILVSAFKIKKGDSYILAGGYTQTPLTKIKFDEVSLKIKTHLQLDQLRKDVLPFIKNAQLKDIQIPEMSGLFESQSQIVKNPQELLTAETKLHFKNLKVDQFYIDNVIGQVFYKDDLLQAPLIQVQSSAGKVQVKDLQFNVKDQSNFKFNLIADKIQLQELLKNLGTWPIGSHAGSERQYSMPRKSKENSFLKCQGEANLDKLRIYNSKLDIVKVDNVKIKGSVEVTKTQVITSGDIVGGKSTTGHASGYVNYEKGFHFDYETPSLNLSDASIANLDLHGQIQHLKGSTDGNSHTATFGFDVDAQDFSIKKYFVGDISTSLSYKSGVIKLKDIDGLLRTTKYVGDLSIFLRDSTVQGSIHSPYIELSDLQKAFTQIVQLPFEFYGGGEATASFSGPLEFPLLSYNLKSRFINGNVANESFDEVIFDVTSDKGHVKADRAYMKKSGGTLTLTGTAEPSGIINTDWVGKNFTLQSLNTFAKAELDIDSDLNFKLNLSEYILRPKSLLTGTLTKTRISQEKLADSQFTLVFGKNTIEGEGKIFGDKIKGKFTLPLAPDAPFNLVAKVDKWDFVPLIHLISSKSRAQEFSTNLTGTVQLSSTKNGFWGSNGDILIQDFNVQRGIKELQTSGPVAIKFEQGHADVKKFFFRGDNTSLEVASQKSVKYPISLLLNGKIDLSLISFLTPFLDDLKGILALTSQFSIGPVGWNIVGSGFINQGFIRTEALPHTFDNIQADLLFNEDKILVNKYSLDFASGKIAGSGSLQINGINNIKTDITGKFNNVTLRVPKDIISKGSGDYHITGNWFPYLFQGSYLIQSGSFTKQLDEESVAGNSFSRSQLLPSSLLKKNYELLLFDMDLIFSKGIDIRNDIMESKAYGQLHMKGPPTQPIFTGQIQLQRNGKIYFKDTVFEIETGELKFNDQRKTNPDIYISANTQLEESVDNRTQRYDISMIFQGKPDKYTISMTSNPPRDQKDIISLLTIGVASTDSNSSLITQPQTQAQTQNGETSSQLAKQSYEVGASLLTKNKFGRDLQNKTGLEFKVTSSFDERTNTTAPKITVSKQWTPKITTSTSRTFGDLTTQDVKVEYHLNKNLSLIGSWSGREISNTNTTTTTAPMVIDQNTADVLGLDLEYKLEYK